MARKRSKSKLVMAPLGRRGFANRLPFSETKRAMIGHGRPASFALALARAALILCACLVNSGAAQNPPPAEPTQLRITWGGGDPVRWVGRIGVDEGTISNLKMLEAEPDAVGSIWLEEGRLHIRSLSAHKVDSIEVTSQVGPATKLQIDLAADDAG